MRQSLTTLVKGYSGRPAQRSTGCAAALGASRKRVMSKRLGLGLIFLAGCTLNSSPLRDGSRNVDGGSSTETINNATRREDATTLDGATPNGDPLATGSAGSDADSAPATQDASAGDAAGAPATTPSTPTLPAKTPPKVPADAGTSSGAAGTSAAGGQGGASGAGGTAATPGAGDAGPIDGGATDVRGTLVDEVFNAFQDRSEGTVEIYMLLAEWRAMAGSGEGLDAPFVTKLLQAMKKSRLCATDRDRCTQICRTIGQDCKPCADDPMCKAALKNVCGPVVAGCFFGK